MATDDSIKIDGKLWREHYTDLTGYNKIDQRLAEVRATRQVADEMADGEIAVVEPESYFSNGDLDIAIRTSDPDAEPRRFYEIKYSSDADQNSISNSIESINDDYTDVDSDIPNNIASEDRVGVIVVDDTPPEQGWTDFVQDAAENYFDTPGTERKFGMVRIIQADGSHIDIPISHIDG